MGRAAGACRVAGMAAAGRAPAQYQGQGTAGQSGWGWLGTARCARGRPAGRAWRPARPLRGGAAAAPGAGEAPAAGAPEHVDLAVREPRAPPSPEHGPQLRLEGKGDAVVDALDDPVGPDQEVARLAVGVVHEGVEEGDPAQARIGGPEQLDDVDVVADVDPELEHPRPGRCALAVDRRRHHVPSGGLRHEVCGDLAVGERPVREVPERPFAADRLVDRGGHRRAPPGDVAVDGRQERGVRRLHQAPDDLDLAVLQERDRERPGAARPRAAVPARPRRGPRARTATPRRPRRDGASRRRAASVDVPVAARAEVARRVERLAAERTGRPPGGDHAEGTLGEGPGPDRRQAHPHEIGPVRVVVRDLELLVVRRRPPRRRPRRPRLGRELPRRSRRCRRSSRASSCPTRKVSTRGSSRGAMSSSAGASASGTDTPRRATSARRSVSRSARTATCTFSRTTETSELPRLAWRKKVRLPGWPTVPATKRSGRP